MGAQNRPREGRRGEQTRLRRRYEPQKVSRDLQEEPKMDSWLPRSSQETPKSTPEKPRRPPRDPQERPKEAQESPKTLSRPPSDRRRRFLKNRAAVKAGARFSRVGRSSWELKISFEEHEQGGKDDLEEDKNQRSSEASFKKLPRSPKVTIY